MVKYYWSREEILRDGLSAYHTGLAIEELRLREAAAPKKLPRRLNDSERQKLMALAETITAQADEIRKHDSRTESLQGRVGTETAALESISATANLDNPDDITRYVSATAKTALIRDFLVSAPPRRAALLANLSERMGELDRILNTFRPSLQANYVVSFNSPLGRAGEAVAMIHKLLDE